jgi:hypothetical protein
MYHVVYLREFHMYNVLYSLHETVSCYNVPCSLHETLSCVYCTIYYTQDSFICVLKLLLFHLKLVSL